MEIRVDRPEPSRPGRSWQRSHLWPLVELTELATELWCLANQSCDRTKSRVHSGSNDNPRSAGIDDRAERSWGSGWAARPSRSPEDSANRRLDHKADKQLPPPRDQKYRGTTHHRRVTDKQHCGSNEFKPELWVRQNSRMDDCPPASNWEAGAASSRDNSPRRSRPHHGVCPGVGLGPTTPATDQISGEILLGLQTFSSRLWERPSCWNKSEVTSESKSTSQRKTSAGNSTGAEYLSGTSSLSDWSASSNDLFCRRLEAGPWPVRSCAKWFRTWRPSSTLVHYPSWKKTCSCRTWRRQPYCFSAPVICLNENLGEKTQICANKQTSKGALWRRWTREYPQPRHRGNHRGKSVSLQTADVVFVRNDEKNRGK